MARVEWVVTTVGRQHAFRGALSRCGKATMPPFRTHAERRPPCGTCLALEAELRTANMPDPNETVTIPRSRYDELIEADRMLSRLEAAGVDNWEGYDDAMGD